MRTTMTREEFARATRAVREEQPLDEITLYYVTPSAYAFLQSRGEDMRQYRVTTPIPCD